ncbi:hypothetical protein BD779DRAFT_1562593 [Infundibulicybe gibba]|nr:hypothetical protein BD779DRAFT_1562593 [Infundibulicybe gibba]
MVRQVRMACPVHAQGKWRVQRCVPGCGVTASLLLGSFPRRPPAPWHHRLDSCVFSLSWGVVDVAASYFGAAGSLLPGLPHCLPPVAPPVSFVIIRQSLGAAMPSPHLETGDSGWVPWWLAFGVVIGAGWERGKH